MDQGMTIENIPIYEVLAADGDVVGYSLQCDPGSGDVAEGRRHQELKDPPGPSSYLHLVGFHTLSEAHSFGHGVVVGRGEDNAGWVAKQVSPNLAVCLVDYYREGPGLDREDYRDLLPTDDPDLDKIQERADTP